MALTKNTLTAAVGVLFLCSTVPAFDMSPPELTTPSRGGTFEDLFNSENSGGQRDAQPPSMHPPVEAHNITQTPTPILDPTQAVATDPTNTKWSFAASVPTTTLESPMKSQKLVSPSSLPDVVASNQFSSTTSSELPPIITETVAASVTASPEINVTGFKLFDERIPIQRAINQSADTKPGPEHNASQHSMPGSGGPNPSPGAANVSGPSVNVTTVPGPGGPNVTGSGSLGPPPGGPPPAGPLSGSPPPVGPGGHNMTAAQNATEQISPAQPGPGGNVTGHPEMSASSVSPVSAGITAAPGAAADGSVPDKPLGKTRPPPPADLSGCVDSLALCSYWAILIDECTSGLPTSCTATCSPCQPKQTYVECEDMNEGCGAWSSRGECDRNPFFMYWNCPKACNWCTKTGLNPSPQFKNLAEATATVMAIKNTGNWKPFQAGPNPNPTTLVPITAPPAIPGHLIPGNGSSIGVPNGPNVTAAPGPLGPGGPNATMVPGPHGPGSPNVTMAPGPHVPAGSNVTMSPHQHPELPGAGNVTMHPTRSGPFPIVGGQNSTSMANMTAPALNAAAPVS